MVSAVTPVWSDTKNTGLPLITGVYPQSLIPEHP